MKTGHKTHRLKITESRNQVSISMKQREDEKLPGAAAVMGSETPRSDSRRDIRNGKHYIKLERDEFGISRFEFLASSEREFFSFLRFRAACLSLLPCPNEEDSNL